LDSLLFLLQIIHELKNFEYWLGINILNDILFVVNSGSKNLQLKNIYALMKLLKSTDKMDLKMH